MAQSTNLNVSPYFDDFDADNNYYKVLFKPGYPVQARELTGLQSMLQNQIATFGEHFFKEGAKIIPGNTSYNSNYFAVQLNNTHLGITVESYINQLLDRKIVGLQSGVTAVINKVLSSADSEKDQTTLYVAYTSSNVTHTGAAFQDGELLAADVDIVSGPDNDAFIVAGESFASAISTNATSTGASFSIADGVYFVRGNFVNVDNETHILSQYSNTPDARIGLQIIEDIITSDEDETLTDNSKGFNNYAAAGADRLKITCKLYSKDLDDFNDDDFIELAVVKKGILKSHVTTTQYSLIADELARRTYAESGDYTLQPFQISVKESLNNNIGNNGVYQAGEFTDDGTLASEDVGVYQVSPGKAFVKGYEVNRISATYKDADKPRTTKTLENQAVNYNTGASVSLNRVQGSVSPIGLGNTYIVSLRDQRVGVASYTAPGTEIGVARVYDFALESGSYNTSNSNINEWDLSLYDIQTYSTVTLNEAITLNTPAFLKGKYSGATGFLRSSTTTDALTIYDKSGEFVANEPLTINGIDNTRVAVAVTSYGMADVKSIYGGPSVSSGDGAVGTAITFTGDTVLKPEFSIGDATITVVDATTGLSTVTSSNQAFPGKLKVGDILRYGGLGHADPSYVRITTVNTTDVEITGVTTVSGVARGKLPEVSAVGVTTMRTFNASDLTHIVNPFVKSLDDTLYTPMPRPVVSSVDLLDSSLIIRKEFNVTIGAATSQLTSAVTAGDNETFLPFDEERYSLIRQDDGVTEVLNASKFTFSNGNSNLQISNIGDGISANQGACLIATLKKLKPKAKIKRKERVNAFVVNKSKLVGSGNTSEITLNDGLTYGSYPYGTRVQDDKICLNTPDVVDVLGVFESTNTDDPSAPKMTLTSIDSPVGKTGDLIIGERVTGSTSGAVALYGEKLSDSQISFLPKNEISFKIGETVKFEESNVQAIITTLDGPSRNVSANYTFSTGQKSTFYNFGQLTRKSDVKEPSRKLKVYFSNGYYESSDDGDITTASSYDGFNYKDDIRTIDGYRNTDIIDIRPRVSDYSVAESDRSPLEFYGRTFNGSGNSAANVLASDESITTKFSFYLGRVDRIYLTKGGDLKVVKGTPSEKLEAPIAIDDALEIAVATLPPYLFNVSDASISFLKHKRYRMKDIRKLETRIKNLEYYTSLSLLETNTANLFVPDANGLNKFKSGFFVDNFTSFQPQETNIKIKNSVDTTNKETRPTHYTNAIDLQIGPVDGDVATLVYPPTPEGTNIKRTGDSITLDYSEVDFINQPFGTRTEFVTPFMVSYWKADIELTPASDTWVDTVRLDARVINVEGDFARTMADASQRGFDPQTGLGPEMWNAWETIWTGTETETSTRTRDEVTGRTRENWRNNNGRNRSEGFDETTTTTTFQDTVTSEFQTGTSSRTGSRELITESWDNNSLGDRTISEEILPFMRSRNIAIDGSGFKPQTRLYSFFDGVNVNKYVVPKLLEISMKSGTFQIGETVTGSSATNVLSSGAEAPATITFRVANCNHKEGPYNAPTRIYANNPYTSETGPTTLETYSGNPGSIQLQGLGNIVPSTYSSTSTILNVDTISLAEQAQGDYWGYVEQGMVLKGETSGAEAEITNLRLISDYASTVQGSFFIPDPNSNPHSRFEVGTKTYTLVDSNNNDQDNADTLGEENYAASGTLETVQENIISVRNARIDTIALNEERSARQFVGSDTQTTIVGQRTDTRRETTRRWRVDPLAQSFYVPDPTGVFVTSIDVYFEKVDDNNLPVTFELRPIKIGLPTQEVLPFSQVNLSPDQITTSTDGSVATRFTFKSPVYLEGGTEYAAVLKSVSTKYKVFISRVGENDTITDEFVSQQPTLGSLFKSQNGSTWEPSQWEDLKFSLYRAQFEPSGTLEIYNPILSEGNAQVPKLVPDAINLQSRKVRVGLGTTMHGNTELEFGHKVFQQDLQGTDNGWYGYYTANAGVATGSLGVISGGLGYIPQGGTIDYVGVALTNISGDGKDATAHIVVTDGAIVSAAVSTSGYGYKVGDVVGFATDTGLNGKLSIVSIASTNELTLDKVQGNFQTGVGYTMMYTNTVGVGTTMNWPRGNVRVTNVEEVNDGLHFVVNHKNHGMHHETNRVTLSGVESDVIPTKLSSGYDITSTASIEIDSSAGFGTFESVSVAATNPGYAQIGNEVIKYTGVSGNTLTGITRTIDSTLSQNYVTGELIHKYELAGVSLRRFNRTHTLSDASLSNPITMDSYTLKLNMGESGIGRSTATSFPLLYMNNTDSAGGYNIKATQNMPFEAISPMVHNITVPGASLDATIRTVTGSSINAGSGQGSDVPFADKGFEAISLNRTNYLNSPRVIASRVNETNSSVITGFSGDRSFNMTLNLSTEDSRISPLIDTQRISAILTSNRVNTPVSNYKTDNRVDSLLDDPHSCQYVSKENTLETSATSIKIILDAHVNEYSDIRAFYSISDSAGFDPVFVPFPGYDNINERGEIIALNDSDGHSDVAVPKSDAGGFSPTELDYKEYNFTANNLPSFKSFRVKLVLTSTNQAYAPRFSNLKVITLA